MLVPHKLNIILSNNFGQWFVSWENRELVACDFQSQIIIHVLAHYCVTKFNISGALKKSSHNNVTNLVTNFEP